MMRILAGATTTIRRIVDLALILLVLVVLSGVLLGKVAPLTGRQTIIVGGRSMEPALPLGAALVISPLSEASLGVGEVVSIQVGPERTTFTHRILSVVDRPDGRWIQTKGDNNPEPDPTLVPASAVIGRVDLSIPLMGYLLAILTLPIGVVFLLGLAATLLAIAWLLESLETDKVETWVVAGAPAGGPSASDGEPLSPRPASPMRRGTMVSATGAGSAGPVYATARPTIPEQLARSREQRARRARWTAVPRRDTQRDNQLGNEPGS